MTSAIADTNTNTNNAQIGLKPFFKSKVEALEIAVRDGTQNLRRLEAQRNELNSRGKKTLSLSLSLSLLKRIQSEVLFFYALLLVVVADVVSVFVRAFDLLFLSLSLFVRLKTKRNVFLRGVFFDD